MFVFYCSKVGVCILCSVVVIFTVVDLGRSRSRSPRRHRSHSRYVCDGVREHVKTVFLFTMIKL